MNVPLALRRRLAELSADPRMQRIVLGLLLSSPAGMKTRPSPGDLAAAPQRESAGAAEGSPTSGLEPPVVPTYR